MQYLCRLTSIAFLCVLTDCRILHIVKRIQSLTDNSRFYILMGAFLLSVMLVSGLRLMIPSDQLFSIRSQQLSGLVAVLLLYSAVILTPISKLVKNGLVDRLLFARRAVGVSAAYFTVLHTIIVLATQSGGLSGLRLLPQRFQIAFILGGIATVILLLMAFTSFDRVIKKMTFRRWKMLHRFVYLAIALVIVHVWMIGTHASGSTARFYGALLLGLLFLLESIRLSRSLGKRFKLQTVRQWLLALVIFMTFQGSLLLLPLVSRNYHSDHTLSEVSK